MTRTVALEAPWSVGRSAALSWWVRHDERFTNQVTRTAEAIRSEGSVPRAQLDAAGRLYGLAMNRGPRHAFDIAKEALSKAAFDALGATGVAAALREAFEWLSGDDPSLSVDDDLGALDSCLADERVMDYLKAAADE